jgi:signal transduction histidine kinase
MFAPPYVGFQVLTFLMIQLLAREAAARESLARANADLLAARERLAEGVRLEERLRIARELHDAMGHHLAGLSLNLEALGQRQGPSPPLATARSLTRRLLDDLETLVDALGREPDLDLTSALAALARDIPRPRVHVSVPGVTIADPRRTHTLWRCCQEIVTNAVKHSEAENLWISIRVSDGRVELNARDDGTGCARPGPGQGLEGMRRRLDELGGLLQLETRQGGGFEVRVTLPAATA